MSDIYFIEEMGFNDEKIIRYLKAVVAEIVRFYVLFKNDS